MDKVAFYKEEIYKEAGILGNAARGAANFAGNVKKNVNDFANSEFTSNAKKNMGDFANNVKKEYKKKIDEKNFNEYAKRTGKDSYEKAEQNYEKAYERAQQKYSGGFTYGTDALKSKYNLDGFTTKAEVNSAMRKHMMQAHPDKFQAQHGNNPDKMKEVNQNFVGLMNDFDNIKRSKYYDKLAYLYSQMMEK